MMQFTEQQIDILTELVNIGMGKAAHTLNQIVGARVSLNVPRLHFMHPDDLAESLQKEQDLSVVRMGFQGVFSGSALLVFPIESASHVADVLIGQAPDAPDLDMIRAGALTEVGNIVLNGVIGSLSNILKKQIHYTIPTYVEGSIDDLLKKEENLSPSIIVAQTHMKVEKFQLEGRIILLFQVEVLDGLVSMINELADKTVSQ